MAQIGDDLNARAFTAQNAYNRLATDGGILSQIEAGDWDDDLRAADTVPDVGEVLLEMEEYARVARIRLEALRSGTRDHTSASMLHDTSRSRLPLNRKERYYTGTVFPMIVAAADFIHLHRLLTLCGLPTVSYQRGEGVQGIQFFTEYSFAESVVLPHDRQRFRDKPPLADTPDIVLVGDDWLLAIEAKMFHHPSLTDMNHQLERQAVLVSYWAEKLGVASEKVRHVALLPDSLARSLGQLIVPTVTWEDLSRAYYNVAPRHWVATLDVALAAEGLYSSPPNVRGQYKDGDLTGQQICDGVTDPATGDAYLSMGRSDGLHGGALAQDIADGTWRSHLYEVRLEGPPNRNWFLIQDFVDKIV